MVGVASDHHIAQLNIAAARAPLDHPSMFGFTSRLDEINALADEAQGFVWRLQTDEGDATSIRAFDDPSLIVNLSVWESIEALHAFTYRSEHRELLRGRREWFLRRDGHHQVLWWVPVGHLPDVDEARRRLDHLERHGPTDMAFTFADRFSPPG